MDSVIDLLTDKIIEAINGNKGNWYLTNSILKEEVPRIVRNEMRVRIESFVNQYREVNNHEQ